MRQSELQTTIFFLSHLLFCSMISITDKHKLLPEKLSGILVFKDAFFTEALFLTE